MSNCLDREVREFRPSPLLKLLRRLARSIDANGVRGAIVHSWRRLVRSLKSDGLRGTLSRAFIKAPTVAGERRQSRRILLIYSTAPTPEVTIPAPNLHGKTLSSFYTTAYYGIAPSALASALSDLHINYSEFTFADVGCGKGRAIVVAAQFPFHSLWGVELSPELCEIARANLALRPEWANRSSIIHEDAASVTYPEGPLLIFMFHPFLAPVLRRVLANLETQLRKSPRTTYVLYACNPRLYRSTGKISIFARDI